MDTIERARLDRGRARVLRVLREAGRLGLTNIELVHACGDMLDAPRRARELRAEGYAIQVAREDGALWRYTLLQSQPLTLTLDRSRASQIDLRGDEDIDGMTQPSLFR